MLKMKRTFKCKDVTFISVNFVLSSIVYVIMKLIFYIAKTRKKTRFLITLEKFQRYVNLTAQQKIIRAFAYNDAMSSYCISSRSLESFYSCLSEIYSCLLLKLLD